MGVRNQSCSIRLDDGTIPFALQISFHLKERDLNYQDNRFGGHFVTDDNDEHRSRTCQVLIAWIP
jgi:hypothetical protein